jgi:hypothetical protein
LDNSTLLGEIPKILTLPEMKLGGRNSVASVVSRLRVDGPEFESLQVEGTLCAAYHYPRTVKPDTLDDSVWKA